MKIKIRRDGSAYDVILTRENSMNSLVIFSSDNRFTGEFIDHDFAPVIISNSEVKSKIFKKFNYNSLSITSKLTKEGLSMVSFNKNNLISPLGSYVIKSNNSQQLFLILKNTVYELSYKNKKIRKYPTTEKVIHQGKLSLMVHGKHRTVIQVKEGFKIYNHIHFKFNLPT